MQNTLNRNTGNKKARGRENNRITRDKLIDRQLRGKKRFSSLDHRLGKIPIEPFSLYLGVVAPPGGRSRTAFPMALQVNGRPQPQYKDLSRWFKLNLLVLAMQEYGFVKFNIHVHPKLEQKWITEGLDPIVEMAERTRKEVSKLRNCPKGGWEFAFVLEGWGKRNPRSRDWSNPKKTFLHLHGFAAIYQDGDEVEFRKAIERACGHGLRGYPKQNRYKHHIIFKTGSRTYVNYLFKYERRKDDRLGYRRHYISHAATQLGTEFWNTITGRDKTFRWH